MNQLNEKIRVLKVQIEAEKGKAEPDNVRINLLENELKDCLSSILS